MGFDIVNDYYDPTLKEARLTQLAKTAKRCGGSYVFIRANLKDVSAVTDCFNQHEFERVIHLAAQAGVRYSLVNPQSYIDSNIVAFTNIIEACRHARTPHLTYASTSSVYGANTTMPFSEHMGVDHPLQFYAATKRANELMAHAYSSLFRLPTTGLRFFTAYGPWGRPDMALFLFTKNILAGLPIEVFNYGKHTRAFTYIDDIVEAVIRLSDDTAEPNPKWDSSRPDPASSSAPFRLFNIGSSKPVALTEYISAAEKALGKKAIVKLLPLQAGDVPNSVADVTELANQVGYIPATPVSVGVANFVAWYKEYYRQ